MSDILRLSHAELTAEISTKGAWLRRLDHAGVPLLFPKQEFILHDGSVKVRGGCHVCLPNFGPGGESELPQHGFARDEEWVCEQQTESRLVLSLEITTGAYAGLLSTLSYELIDGGISMQLTVKNKSESPLRVSPGFHPYFPCTADAVHISGVSYELNNLQEAKVMEPAPNTITISNCTYQLESDGLSKWIAWTDQLGDYVCVEPTAAGFSFLEEAEDDELLQSSSKRSWSFAIGTESTS
jgi:glucose-6-phosphate 1-epimerase